VATLRGRLDDGDAGVRAAAATALGLIGGEAPHLVPPLAGALADRDPTVRAAAAGALGRFGGEASPATPALLKQVNDPDPAARAAAVAALRRVRAGEAEKYLHSGELAKGEKALEATLRSDPGDDRTRFGLGVLRFVRGVERLGQSLHKYGARSENTDIPFLRLPVPANPDPAPITYADLRRLLDDFRRDLAAAEATLAGVKDDHVKLPLRLAPVRLDLRGDGKATDRFTDVLKKIMRQQQFSFLRDNPDFLVCFDRGDVAWLRAYCHLLMGMLDFYLAFDTEPFFDRSAAELFAKPKRRPPGKDDEAKQNRGEPGRVIPVKEPARLGRFRRHFLKVAELNRETWKHIRAETDDDHEWLPNPRQKGVLGLPVREEMIDAWLAMVAELEALLDGKRTLPRTFVEKNGKGLNLKTLFDDPPKPFVLDDSFPRDLPERYFSDEKEVDTGVLIRVYQVFSRDTTAVAYAAWFN
jgi:hypothetical protein